MLHTLDNRPSPGHEQQLSPVPGPLGFGEHRLDGFFGPLEPGKLTLLESTTDYVFDVTYLAMVTALREPGAQVIFVDGCNRINPYVIVNLCKRFRIRPRPALERVQICRAFTAYQMSAIIEDQLEERAKGARLLIACGLQRPYQDKDVWHKEADVLVRRAVQHVRTLTTRYNVVSLVTDHTLGRGGPDFRAHLVEASHRYLRFTRLPKKLRLHDEDRGRTMDYLPVPLNQSVLDEFWEVL
jgi:hypothetical protein